MLDIPKGARGYVQAYRQLAIPHDFKAKNSDGLGLRNVGLSSIVDMTTREKFNE
jgi:hypothetical protein